MPNVEGFLKEKHARWQVTENNPPKERTLNEFAKLVSECGTAIYVIAANEVGDESGTSHQHAFVVFKNAIRGSSLKKKFPRAHLEVCRGNNVSNRDYLVKQGDFIEQGEMPCVIAQEGKLDVASEVVKLILKEDEANDPLSIVRVHPEYADYIVRNFRNLDEMSEKVRRSKRWK